MKNKHYHYLSFLKRFGIVTFLFNSMAYLYRYLTATFEWEENARYLVATAQNPFAHDFLDLGTGPGYIAHELSNLNGARVVGIDNAYRMIKLASTKKNHRGYFIQCDTSSCPFHNDTFDVITARSVLWLVENPNKTLSEAKRVLRKGGHLILVEPLSDGHLLFTLRGAKDSKARVAHLGWFIMTKLLGCFSEEELKSMLTEHGLSIRHSEKVFNNLAFFLVSEKN